MEAKKIALFDMDSTLCNFDLSMRRYLESIAGPNDPPVGNYFSDDIPDYLEERKQLIMRQPNFWRHLHIIPSGIQLLKASIGLGYDVHILTKGPSGKEKAKAWEEKVMWCKENLPVLVKITITEDKSLTYGRVLVDDYPPYVEGWLEWRPRGTVFMPEYDYNKDFYHPNVIKYDPKDEIPECAYKALAKAFVR